MYRTVKAANLCTLPFLRQNEVDRREHAEQRLSGLFGACQLQDGPSATSMVMIYQRHTCTDLVLRLGIAPTQSDQVHAIKSDVSAACPNVKVVAKAAI